MFLPSISVQRLFTDLIFRVLASFITVEATSELNVTRL